MRISISVWLVLGCLSAAGVIQRSSAVPAKSPQGGNEREARGEGFSFPEDSVFFPEEGQRFQRKTEPPRRKPSERRAAATAAAERRKLEKEEKGIVEKTKESFCDLELDPFCEHPTQYPSAIVGRILADFNNSASGSVGSGIFFSPPAPLEDQDFVDGVPPARAEPKLPRPQGKDDGIVSLDGRKKEKQPEEESGSVDNDTNAFDIGGRTSIRVGPADSAPNPASESRPSFSPSSPDKSFSTTTEVSSEPVETYKVENPLCPTVARYVYPKRGKTKDDQFKFIINEPDTAYVQAVRVETCLKAGAPCTVNSDGDNLLQDFDIETVCRQKYTYRRMLALSESGSEEVDFFKFPTSCACFQVEETPFRIGSIPFTDASDRSQSAFGTRLGISPRPVLSITKVLGREDQSNPRLLNR